MAIKDLNSKQHVEKIDYFIEENTNYETERDFSHICDIHVNTTIT